MDYIIADVEHSMIGRVAEFVVAEGVTLGWKWTDPAALATRFDWWLWGNPQQGGCPRGWVAVSPNGAILGVTLVGAQRFVDLGGHVCDVAFSSSSYVSATARGSVGAQLMGNYLALGNRFALSTLTANANGASFFRRLRADEVAGFSVEMLHANHTGVFAGEWLNRHGAPLWLGNAAQWMGSFALPRRGKNDKVRVCHLSGAEVSKIVRHPRWPGQRPGRVYIDTAYLHWRYAEHPFGATGLWEVTATDGETAWLGLHECQRGTDLQIHCISVIDTFGPPELAAAGVSNIRRGAFQQKQLWFYRGSDDRFRAELKSVGFSQRIVAAPPGWLKHDPHKASIMLSGADGDASL